MYRYALFKLEIRVVEYARWKLLHTVEEFLETIINHTNSFEYYYKRAILIFFFFFNILYLKVEM